MSLAALPAAAATLTIGFVDLVDDPTHEDLMGFGSIPLEIRGRPHDGAALAIADAAAVGRALGIEFELVEARAASADTVPAEIEKLRQGGARFVLLDAPGDVVRAVARATRGADVLVFNVAAEDDALRGVDCAPQLLHVIPDTAMLTDALAQYVVARKWRDALVLQGPAPADAATVQAFERAAKRFGVRIVAKRPFVLGNDPRERDQNNLALLTGGVAYDVVFVADESQELARVVPYQTLSPRLVIGAAGLIAHAWHWAWDRDGGSNLSRRFRRLANRPMRDADWAAWVGVKAIIEAAQRTKSTDFAKLAAYIKGGELRIDGSKGEALSFRPWDNQLRQPIQLATDNAVIDQAPLPQFLHQTENLDTLGYDRPDSACRLEGGASR